MPWAPRSLFAASAHCQGECQHAARFRDRGMAPDAGDRQQRLMNHAALQAFQQVFDLSIRLGRLISTRQLVLVDHPFI